MKKKQLLEQLAALKAKREALTAVAEPDNITEHLAATKAAIAEETGVQEQLDAYAEMEKLAKANATRQPAVVLSDNEAKRPFANFGEQLAAIAYAQSPARSFGGLGGQIDKRLLETNLAASGVNSTVPSEGAYMIGTEFSTALLAKSVEVGKIAPLCFDIPIGEGSDGIELPYIDETSRATGSRWGGVRVFRAGEADAPTATKPKFARHDLRLETLKGLAYVTERQLRNAPATSVILENAFGSEMAFMKDDEIWRGTGVGQCLGFSTQSYEGASLLVSVTKKAAQTAATFVIENATSMISRLYAQPGDNVAWFINRNVVGQLPLMTVGQQPVFLPNNNAAGSPYFGTLFGYPVIIVEQAEALGTAGDVVLANCSKYVTISQGALRSAQSMHVRFIYDEMTFKWSLDFNGHSMIRKPITPYKGSATLSPFVTVETRS